ncbi:MAG: hypothetical protein Kow00114_31940 [Kiloniellaceae bacterium]
MVKTTPGTESIENDIHTTRRRIDDRIERIQERLSPGDMVDNVVDFVRSNGGAIAGGIGRTVRDNPVPAAMIGAGILWLALSSRSRRPAEDDSDTAADNPAAAKFRERAGDVRQRAGKIGRQARRQAARARDGSGRFVHEHPILVGAAGVALGAALAASLPRSGREDRAFGERADRVKTAAKDAAVKEGRKVQEAAKAAVKKAKDGAAAKAPDGDAVKRDAAEVAKAATGRNGNAG